MSKVLAKVIKDAISTNGCRMGHKQVLLSTKNAKLIVCSDSLPEEARKKIEEAASSAGKPVYDFKDNSVQLGRLCNKPFRVSVISIEAAKDSDISALLEEINKEERSSTK